MMTVACSKCGSTALPKGKNGDCFEVAACARRSNAGAKRKSAPHPNVLIEQMANALKQIMAVSEPAYEAYRIAAETLALVTATRPKKTDRPAPLRALTPPPSSDHGVQAWLAAMPRSCKLFWDAKGCNGTGLITIGGEGDKDFFQKCPGCKRCSRNEPEPA